MQKYIFINGVMKLNPEYLKDQAQKGQKSSLAQPGEALAIVSSTSDITDASSLQEVASGQPMQLAESAQASMTIMQDPDFLDKFQSPSQIDGGELLDRLSKYFAQYEIPIGLINKLLMLESYKLNFIIDDSGSMTAESDVSMADASIYLKRVRDPGGSRAQYNQKLTRWEEAEDRLHSFVEMLSCIPSNGISLTFLNDPRVISLEQRGKTPDQFAEFAHQTITNLFSKRPHLGTPSKRALTHAFQMKQTIHYFLTDGEPSDCSFEDLKQLIIRRPNPKSIPLCLISCTNDDTVGDALKEIDEAAEFVAEVDDLKSERQEILHDQGPVLPYSKGIWLICQLVAPIDPEILDALDESIPFTKKNLSDFMGYQLSDAQYSDYWSKKPNNTIYTNHYQRWATEVNLSSKQLAVNLGLGHATAISQYGYGAQSQSIPYGVPVNNQYATNSSSYGGSAITPPSAPPAYDQIMQGSGVYSGAYNQMPQYNHYQSAVSNPSHYTSSSSSNKGIGKTLSNFFKK